MWQRTHGMSQGREPSRVVGGRRDASTANRRRWLRPLVFLLCALLLVSCSTSMTGRPLLAADPAGGGAEAAPTDPASPDPDGDPTQAVPPQDDPDEEDPATGGDASIPDVPDVSTIPDVDVGLRKDAPEDGLDIIGRSDSEVDRLVGASLADLNTFYSAELPKAFGLEYVPPENLVSYDATDPAATACGENLYEFVNAFYASYCDTVGWDRGVLLADLKADVGTLAPAVVMSHEIGHKVQWLVGESDSTPTIVLEQQADCYAGAYWRWVADGNSQYYQFNEHEGMRQLLLVLLSLKDPPMTATEMEQNGNDNHGSGFDRTYAAALGYAQGIGRCGAMDVDEIDTRLQEFPFDGIPYQYGNLDMTLEHIEGMMGTVNDYFTATQPGYEAPALVAITDSSAPVCDGFQSTYPVTYCPVDNTVYYDLDSIVEIGTPTQGWASSNGDFSAFTLLASRHALAAQHAGHAPIAGDNAGLQALCYTGTWARWMRTPRSDYQLTPNDLDKAIYQIIETPLAGSDVNGVSSASIIAQVQAFGFGVTHAIPECFDEYLG